MFSFAPLLIGAGVGALGGLLTGKDPLKGAMVGGATGGLFGGMPAGSWTGGGASVAGSQGAAGLTSAAMPSLAPQMATTGFGTAASTGANMLPAYSPDNIGAFSSYDFASGMPSAAPLGGLTEPISSSSENLMLGNRAYQQGGLSAGVPEELSMMDRLDAFSDKISPYVSMDNLVGASSVYDTFSPQEQSMAQAPAGGVSAGKAPQGSDVQALIAGIQPRQRKRITLL